MKRIFGVCLILTLLLAAPLSAQPPENSSASVSGISDFLSGIKAAIQRNLGRPYVWGSTGLKSYDCSGFVWRVMSENGILVKRTTARKFYMMLKPASKEEQGKFGTIVFFDDLKHMGIIESPRSFYHAQVSVGTNLSEMNSFWRTKVYGYRRMPLP
ncbi:MAG TPA: NlpC/P60 family protein [Terriglobia bacterium]|nr:NlpC/P60 family protein [Terriglobia bacterium]